MCEKLSGLERMSSAASSLLYSYKKLEFVVHVCLSPAIFLDIEKLRWAYRMELCFCPKCSIPQFHGGAFWLARIVAMGMVCPASCGREESGYKYLLRERGIFTLTHWIFPLLPDTTSEPDHVLAFSSSRNMNWGENVYLCSAALLKRKHEQCDVWLLVVRLAIIKSRENFYMIEKYHNVEMSFLLFCSSPQNKLTTAHGCFSLLCSLTEKLYPSTLCVFFARLCFPKQRSKSAMLYVLLCSALFPLQIAQARSSCLFSSSALLHKRPDHIDTCLLRLLSSCAH